MSINKKRLFYIGLLAILVVAILYLFPWLFRQVALWQREFNALISDNLHQIKQQPSYAGSMLILISFLYGVFHALGPGHGKFIIASYLSTHQTQLNMSMKLSLLSSLMQGLVAVCATSLIVVMLNLSSAYFKLSQLWLERAAFSLIILLALQWIYQSLKSLRQRTKQPTALNIQTIQPVTHQIKIGQQRPAISIHQHHSQCGCGHHHIPDQQQLAQAKNLRSQFLVILSIGMRPCTGAIFVLFLSYMLDLYAWGIIATFAMAIGTGLTLSAFAAMVQYARSTAIKVGKWYISPTFSKHTDLLLKLLAGVILIFFAVGLLYGTTLPTSGGASLFGR